MFFSFSESNIKFFFVKPRKIVLGLPKFESESKMTQKTLFLCQQLQKISTQNTKKHITQNTCAQHTNPDFDKYFYLKFDSISNKKKFQQNHFRGKKSKNHHLNKFFFPKQSQKQCFFFKISALKNHRFIKGFERLCGGTWRRLYFLKLVLTCYLYVFERVKNLYGDIPGHPYILKEPNGHELRSFFSLKPNSGGLRKVNF